MNPCWYKYYLEAKAKREAKEAEDSIISSIPINLVHFIQVDIPYIFQEGKIIKI